MKLQFKNQDFQTDAVNAVADLFIGQEKSKATFAVTDNDQQSLLHKEFGIGNAQLIDDATLQKNMQAVQAKNLLAATTLEPVGEKTTDPTTGETIFPSPRAFCVEMETGTGKTYVYTKTIFELHKRYGFTKFIILVPSVAIREGVYKSLQITEEHFSNDYDHVPCHYFIFNSAKLSEVRQFATSGNIEIMVMNIDAINKAENIIKRPNDKLNGEAPIRYIQDTAPIVIIDEPQSVDNTDKAKRAVASLTPLCTLRYSATHRDKINLLYRLTPVDAYQMHIVKQIVVSSNRADSDANKPTVSLLSVTQEGGFRAKIQIDVRDKKGKVAPKPMTVKQGDDLFILSGGRELYEGFKVSGIDCTADAEQIEFANTQVVKLGQTLNGVDDAIKKAQIYRTIEAHLRKELLYHEKGIKVLSLFFIDQVKKYRDSADPEGKGIYAHLFEECYAELIEKPDFAPLKTWFATDVAAAHNGYFSQDKKGLLKDTKGNTLADDDTYNTIMKDKEWLLSFECPLRFIFSHSALKEGWDNPNVFQVCTLIEQKSTFTCRQKIGRGLRLCVNQEGYRIEDKEINVLHVMANESFAEFAETLQREIEQETGVKFGVVQCSLFAGLKYEEQLVLERQVEPQDAQMVVEYMVNHGYVTEDFTPTEKAKEAVVTKVAPLPPQMQTAVASIVKAVETATPIRTEELIGQPYTETITVEKTVTPEEAAELVEHFKEKKYISTNGQMKDTLKTALATGTLDLPAKYQAARAKVETALVKADSKPPLRDASREVFVKLKKQVMISPVFHELWDKIKQKTTYRVQIDTEALVRVCVRDLKEMPVISKARIVSQNAELAMEPKGVITQEGGVRLMDIDVGEMQLPHILNIISEETLTKRATIRRILLESGRLNEFLQNPQAFLEAALDIIRHNRHDLAIDGIQYIKLDGQEYYAQEIFNTAELSANLDRNAVPVEHSIYDHVIYDSSTIEKPFAVALDHDPDVKMFFKIPDRFKIDTPIGSYNPDWAVYMNQDGAEKLYFVLETKGTTHLYNLRTPETQKIHCGEEHFKALGNGLDMQVARSWTEFRLGK